MTCLGRAGNKKTRSIVGLDREGTDLVSFETRKRRMKNEKKNTDESAIAVDCGGQPPGVLQRGHFGVQRRRAALDSHVVTRAEAVACAGEQRRADGYAALGEAAFGFVERDGEAGPVCVIIIVVDRVVRCGGGGGSGRFRRRRSRRRYDRDYVRDSVGDDDIDVDVVRRHRHHPRCFAVARSVIIFGRREAANGKACKRLKR